MHNAYTPRGATRGQRYSTSKGKIIKNGEYRDGIKSIGDKIGMVCDAYLRVNLCITLLLP